MCLSYRIGVLEIFVLIFWLVKKLHYNGFINSKLLLFL